MIPWNELKIIGHTDFFIKDALVAPVQVSPVFSSLNGETLFLPPYGIRLDGLTDVKGKTPQSISMAKAQELMGEKKLRLTLFSVHAFTPKPGHVLWLNMEMQPAYEPLEIATKKFHSFGVSKMKRAVDALRQGDLYEASREAEVALLVEPGQIPANALIAACHMRCHEIRMANRRQENLQVGELPLQDRSGNLISTKETFKKQTNKYLRIANEKGVSSLPYLRAKDFGDIEVRPKKDALSIPPELAQPAVSGQ